MRLFILAMAVAIYSSFADAAIRRRKEPCDKQDTFFKHKHEYIYQYTITTSSSFVGATYSKSGFTLSCTATIKVPKKCKYVLELSECQLQARQEGPEEEYKDVDGATDFLKDLERYVVYFQMNKGLLVKGSISTDSAETLQVLNIKRGLLSSLQFQILEADAYMEPILQKDIFGDCPTKYKFSTDNGYRGHTYRNLRECQLGQIFKKQFNSFSSPVRPVTGGYIEEPISEGIYPFVSDITCDYNMNSDQLLSRVFCLQQQYFKPAAFHGDILATAMANISQSLILQSANWDKLKGTKHEVRGLSVIDIRFDFGDIHEVVAEKSDVEDALEKLAVKQVENKLADVPGLFGEMVQLFRRSTAEVLDEVRADVFSCFGDCVDVGKTYKQRYFLDGLASCGTDACLLTVIEAMENDHTKPSQDVEFYQGLNSVQQVSKDVIERLWMYCDSSEKTDCWLSLGTILSKTELAKDAGLPTDSIVSSILAHIQEVLEENCLADEPGTTARELNTAVKTLENIGGRLSKGYSGRSTLEAQLQHCLTNNAIPKSVRRSILQVLEEQATEEGYIPLAVTVKDTLYSLLEDRKQDSVLRARAFSLLMKTTDTDVMERLLSIMQLENQQKQMKSYMSSALRTLLENDSPDMREIKKAWQEYRNKNYFTLYAYKSEYYSYKYSKALNFADFYKLPLTEYFGEQVYVDIVFDSASTVFSALQISVNFFYGDKKSRLFDIDLNIHGFDTLYQMLSEDTGLTFEELYSMYQSAKSNMGDNKAQFAKFQKDIVDAVIRIIEMANHPKLLNFDIEVDLKFQGKNVMFVSVQELLAYMRQMKQQVGHSSSSMSVHDLINGLLGHLAVDSFKSIEFVSLVKVLPTCAGLPLNMTVGINGLNLIQNSYHVTDMTGWNSLDAEASTRAILETEMQGELIIPVGLNYQSGMKMKIHAGSERHANFEFGYQKDHNGHVLVKATLYPIPPYEESEVLFYARGHMFLLHQLGTEEVQADPLVQTDDTKCMNTKFQMLLGRSLCANVKIPDVTTSRRHAFFPLSGPFDIKVTFAKVDSVVGYSWAFQMYKNQPFYDKDTQFINLIHNAPGDVLGRHMFYNITVSRKHRIVNISSGIPDLGFEYFSQAMMDTRIGDVRTFDLEEYMWIDKQPLLGYRLKGVSTRSDEVDGMVINTNLTWPGVSWDLRWEGTRTELPDNGKESVYHLTWKWFCSKDRPLLYLLHLSPTYAAGNEDVTRLGIKYIKTDTKDKNDNSIHVEFYDSVLKATLGSDIAADGKNIRLAYETGGVETVIIGDGTLNDLSTGQGLNYDYNLDINSGDYNMVLTGDASGHPADLTITADLEYSKTEEDDNQITRRKRSIQSIYDNFVKMEKAAAETLKSIAEGLLYEDEDLSTVPVDVTPLEEDAATNPLMGELPNMIPMFPSIWDLPKWNSKVNLRMQLLPKFRGEPSPDRGPDGMELVLTLDVTHPWNGGYRVINEVFKIGKGRKTDYRYFWFWIDNAMELSYNALDGTAILEDGEPVIIKQGGNFNVFRQRGDRFEFNIHQYGPTTTMTYEILFDWGAYGHHEPLFHVQSQHTNEFLPFLNHNYIEYFTAEKHHIVHSAEFNQAMLNVSIQTDFYFDRDIDVWMEQDIAVSLMAFGYSGSFTMKNKAEDKRDYSDLECRVTVSTLPDKILIYTMGFRDIRTIFISGAVIPAPGAPSVPLWNMDIGFIETSMQQATLSWTPALDEKMKTRLLTQPVQNAVLIKSLADNIGQNRGKLVKDQTIWLQGVTPKQLIQKYVFPKLLVLGSDYSQFMANFISLEERQAILDSPGPKVPPRFRQLLGIMTSSDKEPSAFFHFIMTMHYYTLSAASYGYLASASRLPHSPALQEALKKRELSIGWTNLFIIEKYGRFPKQTEAIKNVVNMGEGIIGYYRFLYSRNQSPKTLKEQLAVIFGRRAQDRPIRVQTFDRTAYEIPAEFAEACSYLLAADLMSGQYAVVMTPQGLTVLTSQEAVTISYDNNLYVGNSKQASVQPKFVLDSLTGSVDRSDGKITVTMDVGVTVVCYTLEADVCVIALRGNSRNQTIGLLGTSDRDESTDRRLLDGQMPEDLSPFLQEYVVSGPEKCLSKTVATAPTKDTCNSKFKTICQDQFYKQYNSLYRCSQPYHVHQFKDVCSRESWRCDATEEDKCHVYRAYTALCERAELTTAPIEMSGVCDVGKALGAQTSSDSSLDIVFVISDHKDMLDAGNKPWKFMQEVMTSDPDAWNQFDTVRLGVVGFAGAGDNMDDHVIWQGQSGYEYFSEVDSFDWSLVEVMQGEGQIDIDGFLAVQRAASFPFSPTAHKMIILLMTKEQVPDKGDNPKELMTLLTDKDIVVNVISTYAKVSSRRVIGINWEEKVITRKSGYGEIKALPQNDYTKLVQGTKGVLWDLDVLKGGRKKKVHRMLKEFIVQTKGN